MAPKLRHVGARHVYDELINVADAERAAAECSSRGAGYFAGGAGDEVTLPKTSRPGGGGGCALGCWPASERETGPSCSARDLDAGARRPGRLPAPGRPRGRARDGAGRGSGRNRDVPLDARDGPAQRGRRRGARGAGAGSSSTASRTQGSPRALMDEAVESGFEAIVSPSTRRAGGNRERDLRTGFASPPDRRARVPAALGSERAVTIEETFALMDPGLGLVRPRAPRRRMPAAGPGQGAADRRGRRARGRARRRRSRRLQPRRAPARPRAGERRRAARGGRRGRRASPVLVDGGIRRGVDVVIALALGADAVLVGRPALWGLAAGGEAGARRVLELLRAELELALALCGCASPDELCRAHVRRAPAASVYSVG